MKKIDSARWFLEKRLDPKTVAYAPKNKDVEELYLAIEKCAGAFRLSFREMCEVIAEVTLERQVESK